MASRIVRLSRPEEISMARLLTLRSALRLEIKGMRKSKGPSAHKIIKNLLSVNGSKESVLHTLNLVIEELQDGLLQERK